MKIKTLEWRDGKLWLLDQRLLPQEETYLSYSGHAEVAVAIKDMVVRGAPAIGVTAAFGAALGARQIMDSGEPAGGEAFLKKFEQVLTTLGESRPTAVNLFWAIERMRKRAEELSGQPAAAMVEGLEAEAVTVWEEDLAINKTMGENGATLVEEGDTILTHCNAGALATAGDYGTALGVIKAAHLEGKKIDVFADETRPWLQGARLTTWELIKEEIPVTLISDNMAGHLMSKGLINKVVVGSDRIASNGDVANKIGTYTVAVLAHRHNIPFIVAAPVSTIDFRAESGADIPIEERSPDEVTNVMGKQRIAPEGATARNPAFDVTPAELVSAIVTEKGVARAPFTESLGAWKPEA